MTKNFKLVFIFIVTCLLSACGFHLRGNYNLSPNFKTVYLVSSTPYSPFMNQLRQMLKSSHVDIVNDPLKSPFTLSVQHESFSYSQTSIGSSQSVRQYNATYSVGYVLQNSKGNDLFGPKSVSAQTTITAQPNEELTSSTKLDTAKQNMASDLVSQLLFQLASKDANRAMMTNSKAKPKK